LAQPAENDPSFRLGAALLAAAAGSAIGLLLGILLLYAGWSQSVARAVRGGAIAGAISGALQPAGAMDFVERTVHFFVGFFVAAASVEVEDDTSGLFQGDPERPQWLRWVFFFGALLALVLWALSCF
jgi:hypothetical protein